MLTPLRVSPLVLGKASARGPHNPPLAILLVDMQLDCDVVPNLSLNLQPQIPKYHSTREVPQAHAEVAARHLHGLL